MNRVPAAFLLVCLFLPGIRVVPAEDHTRSFSFQGIEVELAVEPVAEGSSKLMEGEEARISFRITDTTTHSSLSGLHPAAWMEARTADQNTEPEQCQKKIESFLTGSLTSRAETDLNVYYVLALNDDASVSVVDPLFGYGGSKLIDMVFLESPGMDWVLNADESRLFISMPGADKVAVVDTLSWEVVVNIDVGPKPARLAMQPDEKYLWVGMDGAGDTASFSGVAVIDTDKLQVVSRIPTGAGHHEIAFTDDDAFAFVTNREGGTLSIVDVHELAEIKEIKTGLNPTDLVFSTLSQSVYVVNEGDGTIVVLDGRSHTIASRVSAKPGLSRIRLAPEHRLAFILNPKEDHVHILDTSTQRIVQTADIHKRPEQVYFTDFTAYVLSAGTEIVYTIPLAEVGTAGPVPVADFPGGQRPPVSPSMPSLADILVQAPEGAAVLIANPADRMIYYYMEGMAAPMGSFKNYGREPRAVLVVDRSLQETEPGLYSTSARLTSSGTLDVAFFLESPRIVHCFDLQVQPNPALAKQRTRPPAKIEPMLDSRTIRTGEEVKLRFKLTEIGTNRPMDGVKDVGVLTFLSPGIWQKRHWARPTGDGVYEVAFTPPRSGIYFVFLQCPSLGLSSRQLPRLILEASKPEEVSTASSSDVLGP